MGLLYLVHSDVLVENLMVAQKVKTFSNTIFIKPPPFRFILSQLISSLHSSLSFTKLFFLCLRSYLLLRLRSCRPSSGFPKETLYIHRFSFSHLFMPAIAASLFVSTRIHHTLLVHLLYSDSIPRSFFGLF